MLFKRIFNGCELFHISCPEISSFGYWTTHFIVHKIHWNGWTDRDFEFRLRWHWQLKYKSFQTHGKAQKGVSTYRNKVNTVQIFLFSDFRIRGSLFTGQRETLFSRDRINFEWFHFGDDLICFGSFLRFSVVQIVSNTSRISTNTTEIWTSFH